MADSGQRRRWHLYPNPETLAERAAGAILRCAGEAIGARGRFRIVLAGGTTPRAVYERLRASAARWEAWHVYFGDERCLEADHAERNDRMADETWLARVAVPRAQIYRIAAELGPDKGAAQYAEVIAKARPFDLVLLGLGEDGHTASLFPGGPRKDGFTMAVTDAPKAPRERVSLTAQALSSARQVWFLVTGAAKGAAVAAWSRGDDIPAAWIVSDGGVDVFVDQSAWDASQAFAIPASG